MSDFYLTLPSNSSMDVYPNNTMANFKTRLPNRIELEGRWEVGLVEIQYPHTWYNLQDGEGELAIYTPPPDVNEIVTHIPSGYYSSVNELIGRMETEIMEALGETEYKPITFTYDEITRKITAHARELQLWFGETIQRILGFRIHAISDGVTRGEHVVDMDPLHSMYVYCDLLEPRVVGDKMTQLLRVVPVEGRNGDMVTRIYENVHYVPLQRKSFEVVEIDIRDSVGEKVPFERGTLNVTLHFRRRRHLL